MWRTPGSIRASICRRRRSDTDMTATATALPEPSVATMLRPEHSEDAWARALRSGRAVFGGGLAALLVLICLATLFLTLSEKSSLYYDLQNSSLARAEPKIWPAQAWYGYDNLGRSIFARCLLGGTISMGVGVAAATIS